MARARSANLLGGGEGMEDARRNVCVCVWLHNVEGGLSPLDAGRSKSYANYFLQVLDPSEQLGRPSSGICPKEIATHSAILLEQLSGKKEGADRAAKYSGSPGCPRNLNLQLADAIRELSRQTP